MGSKNKVDELKSVVSTIAIKIDKKPYKDMAKAIHLINDIAWERRIGEKVWDEFNAEIEPPDPHDILEVKDFYEQIAKSYGFNEESKKIGYLEELVIWSLLPKQGFVLDAGCGAGRYSIAMAKSGCKVVGIDLSPHMLALAKKKVKGANAEFIVGDLRALKFKDNTFEHSICTLVLNDIENWKKVVKELVRVTKPGGSIIFSTIHPSQFGLDKVRLTPYSKTGKREIWAKQYVVPFSELFDAADCRLEKYLEVSDRNISEALGMDELPLLQIACFTKWFPSE